MADISDIANAGTRTIMQLDVVAHNLANISTTGFKAEHLYYAMNELKTLDNNSVNPEQSLGAISSSSAKKVMDLSQGVLEKSGNNLDMAIEGEGFFSLQQKTGTAYTRNGNFVINKNNELVTKNGVNVLGESGPIKINGKSIEVDSDGTIRVDGNTAGKLKIAAFRNPGDLTKINDGQFIDEGKAGLINAEKYRVAGGYLEASNVNAIKEMIEMIDLQRSAFETYQKVTLTLSDFDKISTSRIGKLI
jgi:flagellar basal-body rod protein FlgF